MGKNTTAEQTPTPGQKTVPEKAALKRKAELERGKTKVAIGKAFERWRKLKSERRLQTDAMVAEFLLNR